MGVNKEWREANNMQTKIGWSIFKKLADAGFNTKTASKITTVHLKLLLTEIEKPEESLSQRMTNIGFTPELLDHISDQALKDLLHNAKDRLVGHQTGCLTSTDS